MTDSVELAVETLRARLARRQECLLLLRKRIDSLRAGAGRSGRAISSVGDISRRFMNAAAESEARAHEASALRKAEYVAKPSNGGVASLMSKWNKGIDEIKVEKETVSVRGSVRDVKDKFNQADSSLATELSRAKIEARRSGADRGVASPEGVLAVVDDDVPAWAINQEARVIRKENAKALTSGVNLQDTSSGFMSTMGADIDTSSVRESNVPRGNVSGVLAMWATKAEDQEAREREQSLREETMRRLHEDMGGRNKMHGSGSGTASNGTPGDSHKSLEETTAEPDVDDRVDERHEEDMRILDMEFEEEEPTDIREVVGYLERKCEFVEKQINCAEEELEQLGQGAYQ